MSHENDFVISKYEWPYPIRYDVENMIRADVLVLGGGIAGCWAAISAARRGANVVMVEKAATIKSGGGGSGCDHWNCAATNPCSKVTPEELGKAIVDNHRGWVCGIPRYLATKDGYDTLLELEQMGGKIRDTEDEFKGAEFRDDATKFLFAYEYENKFSLRVWGTTFKPALYRECKRLGVNIYDRVMVTSLLTEGGNQGARVVGATGVNVQTGEFYVFAGKATVLGMSRPSRMWVFSTEYAGLSALGPTVANCTGDGHAMAWNAGAEFTLMERSRGGMGGGPGTGFSYPDWGSGGSGATMFASTMVDANGKEIPWVDRDGNVLTTVSQRYRPVPGQRFVLRSSSGLYLPLPEYEYVFYEQRGPEIISRLPDFKERVEKGEFKLPLYVDYPSMPEHERRVIYGLMVGQEGNSWIAYHNMTQAGFDPDTDLLQSYTLIRGGPTTWRSMGMVQGGLVVDWDMKTNLPGLYTAGRQVFGSDNHSNAATTGRWAGAKAADYALQATKPVIERSQVAGEKSRVYAPLQRTEGVEWKEFNAGICRVMQEWCGERKSAELLTIGLTWLKEIREKEARTVYARNPHELMRVLESFTILTVGEMILHACLARKASSKWLGFYRIDYPKVDPPEWDKYITLHLENGEVKIDERPLFYWLKPPYTPTYKENYEKYKPW
jgi:succinate dehydrogenase/fumarate reductase flavoprotein subunit